MSNEEKPYSSESRDKLFSVNEPEARYAEITPKQYSSETEISSKPPEGSGYAISKPRRITIKARLIND